MRAVQVSRWSQAAARLVPPRQVVIGRVHSAYARVINVRTPADRLLTLQAEGRLQAPLALALATDMAGLGAHLPVGALVVQDLPVARRFPAALRLRCAAAIAWDGTLPPQPGVTPPVRAQIAVALTAWLGRCAPAAGLAPLLLALAYGTLPRSVTCRAIYTVLAPLWAARRPLTETALLALVRDLVGLGEGLTPSGDDFLVGLLAALRVTGCLPPLADSAVRGQFDACIRSGTSQLSGEFVRCALAGHFAEPVVMLMRSLCTPATGAWQAHAADLASVGHSSGIDAMVGMAFGYWLLA